MFSKEQDTVMIESQQHRETLQRMKDRRILFQRSLDALTYALRAMEERDELLALVKEASEIMTITYAGDFPAGIESFLVRSAVLVKKGSADVREG